MSGSESSSDEINDGVLSSIHDYIKTLEELILRLKIDHEARKSASTGALESEHMLLEEHVANINSFASESSLRPSLQLAHEQVNLLLEVDSLSSEVMAICAENQRICKEVMKKQQELDKANATIRKLKTAYHGCIGEKIPPEEMLDQGRKRSLNEKICTAWHSHGFNSRLRKPHCRWRQNGKKATRRAI
ncbi:uncharacterized protein [Dermacentor albipictus]|uniref:uncharacterized protein isoform X2 n=1 Tax=Dermacentor albipictus TaxID=60249 RepID=UPI0031FD1F9C